MTTASTNSTDRLEYEIFRDVEDWRAGRLETVTLDELEQNLDLRLELEQKDR